MHLIIIQILFAISLWFEAMHDHAVIELQNYQHPKYNELSKDWHRFNAWQYALTCIIISWLSEWYWLFPCLLLLRSSVFPFLLNIMRGMSPFYLSNKGFDLTMQKILGRLAGVALIVGSLLAIILINLYL